MKTTLPSGEIILDVGTCSLHIVNGAYKTAHLKSGWNLNEFLRVLYRFFKNYPSRRANYTQITGSSIFPKKFCAVRWTENSSVIQRCIDMLPYLRKYVTIAAPDFPENSNFISIKNYLKDDPTLEAKLYFSCMIAQELEEFLICFQKNDPLLPFLHQEVYFLMKILANKFIKRKVMEEINSSSKLKKIDLEDQSNFKNISDIDIGFGAKASLKNIKEIHSQKFKQDCKKFLITMYNKLIEKSPINKRVVLGASCINPAIMRDDSLRESRLNIAIEEFVSHYQLSPAEGDIVKREFIRMCENEYVKSKISDFNWKKQRLDHLFGQIFENIEGLNTTLMLFIKKYLVCFHGNAAVERSFSFNKTFLVENLEERSLVAQRHLHDFIHTLPGGISSFEVNRNMLLHFRNASSCRKEALKVKKEEEDKCEIERKRVAQEIKTLKLKKQKLLEEKSQELSYIDKKLNLLEQKKT